MRSRRFSNRSLPAYAASPLFLIVCASAASITACGVCASSAASSPTPPRSPLQLFVAFPGRVGRSPPHLLPRPARPHYAPDQFHSGLAPLSPGYRLRPLCQRRTNLLRPSGRDQAQAPHNPAGPPMNLQPAPPIQRYSLNIAEPHFVGICGPRPLPGHVPHRFNPHLTRPPSGRTGRHHRTPPLPYPTTTSSCPP